MRATRSTLRLVRLRTRPKSSRGPGVEGQGRGPGPFVAPPHRWHLGDVRPGPGHVRARDHGRSTGGVIDTTNAARGIGAWLLSGRTRGGGAWQRLVHQRAVKPLPPPPPHQEKPTCFTNHLENETQWRIIFETHVSSCGVRHCMAHGPLSLGGICPPPAHGAPAKHLQQAPQAPLPPNNASPT